MKFKVGDSVVLKECTAKWHLNTPEIYIAPGGGMDDDYESETLIHLMCCMGVPIIGRITARGNDCWYVLFKCAGITAKYYVVARDIRHA